MTRSARWKLAFIGAVVGGLIGPIGFLLRERRAFYSLYGRDGFPFPGPASDWMKNFGAIAKIDALRTFAIIAFVATLLLMPVFLRWLERRADRPASRFYLSASIGGIFFGVFATVLTAWGIFVALMFAADASGAAGPKPVSALMFGAAAFGPIIGLTAAVMFILEIFVAGIPFGAAFGAAVRAQLRQAEPPTS